MSLLTSETAASSSDQTEAVKAPMDMFDNRPLARPQWQTPQFSVVNALWVDNSFPLVPSFKEITESIYKAQVESVDLCTKAEKVKKRVNSWVKKETKGLIKVLLPPHVELEPPLCLANALYFKGAWEDAFDDSMTLDKNFHLLNRKTMKVPFMISKDVYRSYASFDDYKVLKLPYQRGQCTNKQYSMYFFLPHRRKGLQDMVKKFNSDTTMLQPKCLHLREVELSHVWIPKLKFSYCVDAAELIESKGLALPFNPTGANFTNMVNVTNVFINRMLHKSYIEVNEEGTEASAATFADTYVGYEEGSEQPPPRPSFIAHHPFMFMIAEEFSNLVIFTGALLNPTED
ncbi:Serpin family [Trema orientale]|uniref:Serpin family n=1 Tax=Trema orientale TaxID=63057 RepID=A0A2P5BU59_TREOI|nr:Serpin family [Trema orientale]